MARTKAKKDLGSVLAEANAATPTEKPKRTRRKRTEGWPCTAEQITDQRDVQGFSWKQVAVNLGLDNPGQARKAYQELTGRHHSESGGVKVRAPRGSMTRGGKAVSNPNWNDESDQDEIAERLDDATIVVRRSRYGVEMEEEVTVWRVIRFYYSGKDEDGPLSVDVSTWAGDRPKRGQGLPTRSFRVQDIVSVR